MSSNLKIWGLLLMLFTANIQAKASDSLRYKKLDLTAKVWGLSVFKTEKKLSSPDKELSKLIELTSTDESFEQYQKRIIKWHHRVYKSNTDKSCKCYEDVPYSLNWVKDKTLLGEEFSNYLIGEALGCKEQQNSQFFIKDYLPTFYDDKFTMKKSDTLLTPDLQLLAGIKYWNIVNYFYPYASDSTLMWSNQINDIIHCFDTLSNYSSYIYTLLNTSQKLKDGHARIYSSWAANHLFKNEISFETEVYEEYAIVTRVDSSETIIRRNDLILEVNGRPISEHLEYWERYLSSSTRGWFLHNVRNYLFTSQDSTMELVISRDGELFTEKVNLVNSSEKGVAKDNVVYNMNKDSIGYIDIGNLELHHISALKKQLQKAKAIIIDARHYPNSTLLALSSWLVDEQKLFAYHSLANSTCLGNYSLDSSFSNSNESGKYKGTVVFVVDRSTISQGEYMAMAFMHSSNVITIGRITAGSVGLTSMFSLPGKISCRISTSKVFFPNHQLVQQNGIKPSIDLSNSSGITNSDQLIEFAFKYIEKIILKRQ